MNYFEIHDVLGGVGIFLMFFGNVVVVLCALCVCVCLYCRCCVGWRNVLLVYVGVVGSSLASLVEPRGAYIEFCRRSFSCVCVLRYAYYVLFSWLILDLIILDVRF